MPELKTKNPNQVYQLKAHIYNMNHIWRRFEMNTDSSLDELRHVILCLFDLREDFPYLFRVGGARYSELGLEKGEGKGVEKVDLATVPLRDAVELIKKEKIRNKKSLFFSYESPDYRDYVKSHGEHRPRDSNSASDSESESESGSGSGSNEEVEALPGYAHWYIVISFEGELPAEEGQSYPVCTAGERASPPDITKNYSQYQWIINNLKMMGRSRFTEVLKRSDHSDDKTYIPLLESDFDPAVFAIENVNSCLGKTSKK